MRGAKLDRQASSPALRAFAAQKGGGIHRKGPKSEGGGSRTKPPLVHAKRTVSRYALGVTPMAARKARANALWS